MKRFTRVLRTRSRSSEDRQRGEFQKQLLRDGEKLLEKLSRQFADDLNAQLAQILGDTTTRSTAKAQVGESDVPGIVGGISQLLSTGVRYLVSRPRTSSNTTAFSTRFHHPLFIPMRSRIHKFTTGHHRAKNRNRLFRTDRDNFKTAFKASLKKALGSNFLR